MAELQDELAELDGEQCYHLLGELIRNEVRCESALASPSLTGPERESLNAMALEFIDVRLMVMMQLARITVPIAEAVKIIYRARYARNHPVRVPGTA